MGKSDTVAEGGFGTSSRTRERLLRARAAPILRLVFLLSLLSINLWYLYPRINAILDPEPALEAQETLLKHRALKILAASPLVDGHNDLFELIRIIYKNDINSEKFRHDFENGTMPLHVDLPRLRKGKVGGTLWSAWQPCPENVTDFSDEAYEPIVRDTYEQLDLHARLAERYPHFFTPTPNAAAAEAAFKKHRLISPSAIEGLHQIGNSLVNLRTYFRLGVRYATLTWNCHNKYADSALTTFNGSTKAAVPLWHGVSQDGRELIEEMNRLGMMVDISHVSKETMIDVLGGSAEKGWNGSLAPPIFSHSSAYAICPHPRNVPDDVLQLVKARNSLVMVNIAPDFISCTASNSSAGLPDFFPANSTLEHAVSHIRYIGDRIGYDHVGIGTDFDGIETVPRGFEDVSKFPDLVAELLRWGISDEDAGKVVGRNLLRVWAEVDRVAERLQRERDPLGTKESH